MRHAWRPSRGLVVLLLLPGAGVWAQTANPNGVGPQISTPAAATPAAAPDPSYLKLREIEERVSQLKEKVFQAKARLVQLQEVVLHGTVAGAKLVLVHRNDMGGSFRLARLQYYLDGAVIFNRSRSDNPDLDKQHEQEVFNGPIAPGSHQVSVFIEYAGNGYGLFNYLEGYTFRVKAGQTFMAEEGHVVMMKVVGYEQGSFLTEMKDRPAVRFESDGSSSLKPADAAATDGSTAVTSGTSPDNAKSDGSADTARGRPTEADEHTAPAAAPAQGGPAPAPPPRATEPPPASGAGTPPPSSVQPLPTSGAGTPPPPG